MAQLTVRVNGRDYLIACGDGEEPHLLELAEHVNRRVEDLVDSVGQVGEARLLLVATLLLADELAAADADMDAAARRVEQSLVAAERVAPPPERA